MKSKKVHEVHLGSTTIEISNPEKVLYPEDGITKADLVGYYQRIAETMLPHIREHPINMQRFPNGIEAGGFYEKEIPDYFPDWVGRTQVYLKGKDEMQDQVVCNDAATLVYLAEQACLTPHAWLSRADRLDFPDKMVFDLDPPDTDFELVKFAAKAVRDILNDVELKSFLMTTGSRGLHVVVPLDRTADFDTTRQFARDLVEALAQREPEKLTTEVRKDQRRGRLFLDYLRNSYAHTSVPPYALRAVSGAPVATPLDWEELEKSDLHAGVTRSRISFSGWIGRGIHGKISPASHVIWKVPEKCPANISPPKYPPQIFPELRNSYNDCSITFRITRGSSSRAFFR
jgi:bifunctional non-homologous end joining protein LigD